MAKTKYSNRILACVLLIVMLGGVGLAQTVNINPHKIVLNAKGAYDDVQANVNIVMDGTRVVEYAGAELQRFPRLQPPIRVSRRRRRAQSDEYVLQRRHQRRRKPQLF